MNRNSNTTLRSVTRSIASAELAAARRLLYCGQTCERRSSMLALYLIVALAWARLPSRCPVSDLARHRRDRRAGVRPRRASLRTRSYPPGRIIATRRRGRLSGAHAAAGLALPAVALEVQGRDAFRSIEVAPGQIALVVAKDGAAIPSERVLAQRGRLRQLPGRRAVPRERRRERPSARACSRPASTGSTRRCSTSSPRATRAALRPRRRAARGVSRAVGSRRHRHGARRPADPAGRSRGPDRRRSRQLSARAGVHRGRRLPRSAGGGAAVGRVEPQPVVRRRSSSSRSPRSRSATSASSSATSAASTSTSPAMASRTAISSSAAARACGSSRCCPASTRSTRAR